VYTPSRAQRRLSVRRSSSPRKVLPHDQRSQEAGLDRGRQTGWDYFAGAAEARGEAQVLSRRRSGIRHLPPEWSAAPGAFSRHPGALGRLRADLHQRMANGKAVERNRPGNARRFGAMLRAWNAMTATSAARAAKDGSSSKLTRSTCSESPESSKPTHIMPADRSTRCWTN
jgi:hypothetical protein